MSASAKMSVMVGERFACVKISGRANFNSSIDFRTLLQELRSRGYEYFVLELSECALMDSTFLGVLAGFGLKMNPTQNGSGIELLNPNPRIVELLENLGVLQLFRVNHGQVDLPAHCESVPAEPTEHSKLETTKACLEAHQTLIAANPANAAKFKEVTRFLAEDLKRLRVSSATPG